MNNAFRTLAASTDARPARNGNNGYTSGPWATTPTVIDNSDFTAFPQHLLFFLTKSLFNCWIRSLHRTGTRRFASIVYSSPIEWPREGLGWGIARIMLNINWPGLHKVLVFSSVSGGIIPWTYDFHRLALGMAPLAQTEEWWKVEHFFELARSLSYGGSEMVVVVKVCLRLLNFWIHLAGFGCYGRWVEAWLWCLLEITPKMQANVLYSSTESYPYKLSWLQTQAQSRSQS